jgi:hypothetical protein
MFLFGLFVGGFVIWLCMGLALTGRRHRRRRESLDLRVICAWGKECYMGVIDRPGIEFVDVEKVLLSIAPKDADGRTVKGTYLWEVIEQVPVEGEVGDVLTLEVVEDGLSAWAISGAPGTAIVEVVDADADLTERMPVTIKYGQPSELNLSAGAPVPEV